MPALTTQSDTPGYGDAPVARHHVFVIDGGHVVADGKSHWPDFLQIQVSDPLRALEIAQDLLRQAQARLASGDRPRMIEMTIAGKLARDDE